MSDMTDHATKGRLLGRSKVEDLVIVPLFALVAALILGAVVMVATGVDLATIGRSYVALLQGSVGSVNAISETLTAALPLVLAGLGLALGFRAGLFNIGAEGQVVMGGLAAVVAGVALGDLPAVIALPGAILAGAVTGAFYAGIAGWLRAATGAHEVISTIMLNLISYRLLDYLLRTPLIQKEGRADPISKSVPEVAELPRLLTFLDPNLRLHAGIFLTLAMVALAYWLLFRSKLGFEFRASGENAVAARFAGMNASLTIVLAMAIAGALAGIAGANQTLGVLGRATPGFSAGIGFDAIAVALLGRSHPVGVLFAGVLFGALEAGGRQMQVDAGVSIDLIGIIQSLIIVFIAAPLLVKALFPWGFRRDQTKEGGS
ncbi:ABC transporter permease [Aliiroseovarius zhejiangensis]|uniref:ABC transporter permease n=1 Tax=Aliiroseovarius zhejiangensis TaxID=1632025 RepID=A0ABQ3IJW7_9RHOB|nr:ABC transporter permease [Aliiroseovarius zhejiangensis]GHE85937.1 ABC transporter permease [Aliiroseovarius zhejiangensis]